MKKQGYLSGSNKRKRKKRKQAETEEENGEEEEDNNQDEEEGETEGDIGSDDDAVEKEEDAVEVDFLTTPMKRIRDNRRWCVYCTRFVKEEKEGGGFKLMRVCRFEGWKIWKTSSMCWTCKVPLCEGECFQKWHSQKVPLVLAEGEEKLDT